MNPRRGENPPLSNNSRSQIWRAVRSHDGHSREWAFNSAAFSAGAIRLTSSPPCGAIKWLVEADKRVNLPGSLIWMECIQFNVTQKIPMMTAELASLGGYLAMDFKLAVDQAPTLISNVSQRIGCVLGSQTPCRRRSAHSTVS